MQALIVLQFHFKSMDDSRMCDLCFAYWKQFLFVCMQCADILTYLFLVYISRVLPCRGYLNQFQLQAREHCLELTTEHFDFYKEKTPITFLQVGLTWEGYYATWSHYELPYRCVVQSGFFFPIIILDVFLILTCMKKSLKESKNIFQLKAFFCRNW